MATQKQINYALFLLDKKGYSTEWMNSEFKDLGASMRERSGKVEDWLKSINVVRLSKLIEELKE